MESYDKDKIINTSKELKNVMKEITNNPVIVMKSESGFLSPIFNFSVLIQTETLLQLSDSRNK